MTDARNIGEGRFPPVKLEDLIDALEFQPEGVSSYLDRATGDVYAISEDAFRLAEDGGALCDTIPEWQQEEVEWARRITASDRYLALPTSWDMHEWAIMQQFCYSIAEDRIRAEFLAAVRGHGAFSRFKYQLARHGLWETWNPFRRLALRMQLIEWCQMNGVPLIP